MNNFSLPRWAKFLLIFLAATVIFYIPYGYYFSVKYHYLHRHLAETEGKIREIPERISRLNKDIELASKSPAQFKKRFHNIKQGDIGKIVVSMKKDLSFLKKELSQLEQRKTELLPQARTSKILYIVSGIPFFLSLAILVLMVSLLSWKFAFNPAAKTIEDMVIYMISGAIIANIVPNILKINIGSEPRIIITLAILLGPLAIVLLIKITLLAFVLLGAFLNIPLIQKTAGEISVNPKKLLKYGLELFIAMFLVFSFVGLLIGLMPRITPVYFWSFIILFLAGFIIFIILKAKNKKCPQCGQKATFSRMRFFSRIKTVRGCLLNIYTCKNCGCTIKNWDKIEDAEKIPMGSIFRQLGIAGCTATCSIFSGILFSIFFWRVTGDIVFEKAKKETQLSANEWKLPETKPAVPDDENAVYWVQKAGESKSIKERDYNKKFYKDKTEGEFLSAFIKNASTGKVSQEEISYARKLTEKYKEPLALLKKGTSKKKFSWDIEWKQPVWSVKIPKYSNFSYVSKLLACRSILDAVDGRIQESVGGVRDGLSLAYISAEEPQLISQMISCAVSRDALSSARFVIQHSSVKQAAEKWEPLLDFNLEVFQKNFFKCLWLEFFIGPEWLAEISYKELRTSENWGVPFFYWAFLKWDVASFYRYGINLLKAMDLPYSEVRDALEKTETEQSKKLWLLASMAMPRFGGFYGKFLTNLAELRLARTSLDILSFKEKEKHWPATMTELRAKIKDINFKYIYMDPFNGRRNDAEFFKFKQLKSGMTVYSIGPDGADDGGIPWDDKAQKGDIVWMLQ